MFHRQGDQMADGMNVPRAAFLGMLVPWHLHALPPQRAIGDPDCLQAGHVNGWAWAQTACRRNGPAPQHTESPPKRQVRF